MCISIGLKNQLLFIRWCLCDNVNHGHNLHCNVNMPEYQQRQLRILLVSLAFLVAFMLRYWSPWSWSSLNNYAKFIKTRQWLNVSEGTFLLCSWPASKTYSKTLQICQMSFSTEHKKHVVSYYQHRVFHHITKSLLSESDFSVWGRGVIMGFAQFERRMFMSSY